MIYLSTQESDINQISLLTLQKVLTDISGHTNLYCNQYNCESTHFYLGYALSVSIKGGYQFGLKNTHIYADYMTVRCSSEDVGVCNIDCSGVNCKTLSE